MICFLTPKFFTYMKEEKAVMRRKMRKMLRECANEERRKYSSELVQRLLSHKRIADADAVIAFWPLPDEIDITEAIDTWYMEGKNVFLPKVVSETEMIMCRYDGYSSLSSGSYGILEPMGESVCIEELYPEICCDHKDACRMSSVVMLVPGVAFDTSCHRLGRGKGYYDRYLFSRSLYTIGICYPFQVVHHVPYSQHDIAMSELVVCPLDHAPYIQPLH